MLAFAVGDEVCVDITVAQQLPVDGYEAQISLLQSVASTYKAETLQLLPVGRTLNAAALLAPGVQDNGPGGNIMISGAMSL